MNVELKQAEIEIAIADYMRKTGVVNPVESMDFLAGRRGNGVSVALVFAANTTEVPITGIDVAEPVEEPFETPLVKLEEPMEQAEAPCPFLQETTSEEALFAPAAPTTFGDLHPSHQEEAASTEELFG